MNGRDQQAATAYHSTPAGRIVRYPLRVRVKVTPPTAVYVRAAEKLLSTPLTEILAAPLKATICMIT